MRSSARQPCGQQNCNRLTRGSQHTQPVLRSQQQFSWEKVLLSDPEKQFRVQAGRLKQYAPRITKTHLDTLVL